MLILTSYLYIGERFLVDRIKWMNELQLHKYLTNIYQLFTIYIVLLIYSNPSLSAKVTFQQTCADNKTMDNETINQCKKGG
jgi:hypothetical protein